MTPGPIQPRPSVSALQAAILGCVLGCGAWVCAYGCTGTPQGVLLLGWITCVSRLGRVTADFCQPGPRALGEACPAHMTPQELSRHQFTGASGPGHRLVWGVMPSQRPGVGHACLSWGVSSQVGRGPASGEGANPSISISVQGFPWWPRRPGPPAESSLRDPFPRPWHF